jgi:putative hydrolase of the HAD superfamily
MVLSMVEAAVEITEARISAADLHRIVELGKALLRHPVELLPGVREAVERVAAELPVVLITKGDLFHQEAKVRDSGLSDLFRRIEIVSEKDTRTYARLFAEFGIAPAQFLMVGNSLRSDIAPVLELGGWDVPYHVTWAHEAEADVRSGAERMRSIPALDRLPLAVRELTALARS